MNAAVRLEERFDWQRPDYAAILQKRLERLHALRDDQKNFIALRSYYRTHIADFISDWCMTYDPRRASKGTPCDLPFLLFPKQREWIDYTYQNWRDGKYGGTEKSRDVGLSWLAIAFSVALCTLYDRIAIGLGSYKQEKVDWPGEMGSLFEKARYLAKNLPIEFRGGFDVDTCSTERKLLFPATGSSLIGEIGDNIGRGGRTSIYFVDEAAYLEHDLIVDMALSKNTPCRQDISSVRGSANSFAQRMHDGYSRKFTFHWRSNPLFTQADYDDFYRQWGSVVTAQELDIDYQASVEKVILRSDYLQACVDADIKLGIEPSGERFGALDVADLGRDLNAFAARHGQRVLYCQPWSGRNSDMAQTIEECYSLCDEHKLGGFLYDADGGMGAGIRAFANQISERRRGQGLQFKEVLPFRGSGEVLEAERQRIGTDRTNKDMFQNFKAQGWYELAQRVQETFYAVNGKPYDREKIIIFPGNLPMLAQLLGELAQPQWKYSATGKLMVDKVPDGKKSPNMADAVMMLFSPRPFGLNVTDAILNYESDVPDQLFPSTTDGLGMFEERL